MTYRPHAGSFLGDTNPVRTEPFLAPGGEASAIEPWVLPEALCFREGHPGNPHGSPEKLAHGALGRGSAPQALWPRLPGAQGELRTLPGAIRQESPGVGVCEITNDKAKNVLKGDTLGFGLGGLP